MSVNVGQIDLGLDINKNYFDKQLKGIAGGAEKNVTKLFGGLGKALGLSIGFAAVASFTKSSLGLGSALTEVQNVVDTVFPEMNEQVNGFAYNAMEQFGLSETIAKKYTGTLGAMSKAMGFAEGQAYNMATSVAGLSGDVASFFNMSSDEAYGKLKSIWTGETESLKDLGIIMTQANLDQYALNEGFGKTTKSMTEQEKTMLRYKYVLSGLSDASGDFAKTSDSWANQTRVLGLRFEALQATIGQGFILVFKPIVRGLNLLISKLQIGAEYFKAFISLIYGTRQGSNEATKSNKALVSSTEDTGEAVKTASKAIKGSLSSLDELNVLTQDTAEGMEATTGASSLMDDFDIGSDGMSAAVNLEPIQSFYDSALAIFNTLYQKVKLVFDTIWSQAIAPAMHFVKSIVLDALTIINNWWDKWGKAIMTKVSDFINHVVGLFKMFWDSLLLPVIQGGLKMFKWLWDEHMKGYIEIFLEFVGKLITGALDIWNGFILPLAGWMIKTFGPVLANTLQYVMDVFGTLLGIVLDVASGLLKSLGGVIDFLVGVFTGDWEKALNGISAVFEGVFMGLEGIAKGAVNLVIDALNWMIRKINGIKIDVPEWVSDTFGMGDIGFNIRQIPKLANGGLVSAPTLAMVGDNKNASTDPEVIAPLSKLEGILDNSGNQKVVDAIMMLIEVMENKEFLVDLDGETIYKNQEKVKRNRGVNLGLGAFAR